MFQHAQHPSTMRLQYATKVVEGRWGRLNSFQHGQHLCNK